MFNLNYKKLENWTTTARQFRPFHLEKIRIDAVGSEDGASDGVCILWRRGGEKRQTTERRPSCGHSGRSSSTHRRSIVSSDCFWSCSRAAAADKRHRREAVEDCVNHNRINKLITAINLFKMSVPVKASGQREGQGTRRTAKRPPERPAKCWRATFSSDWRSVCTSAALLALAASWGCGGEESNTVPPWKTRISALAGGEGTPPPVAAALRDDERPNPPR